MADRVKPREIIQDPDAQLISSMGGLSSATYNTTGDIIYQDKLVNAFVDKNGEVRKRSGSVVNTSIPFFDNATGNGVQRFIFDDIKYMIAKVGRSIILAATVDNVNYTTYRTFTNVINTIATNDKPSFAVKVEGNYCHVLIATANQQMLSLTIVKSVLLNTSISSNTLTATLRVPISGSILSAFNTKLIQDDIIILPSSITQTNASLSLVTSTINLVDNTKPMRLHSYFLLRFVDAQYMPGLYLVNSALRRNAVPLDVNVQVPQELQTNPIINEPIQDVSQETLWVYSGNSKNTKVSNRQPANGNEWDFSDGSYFTGAGLFTNRSPSFVSFGGYSSLATSGSSTTITIARLRNLLIDGNTGGGLVAYVDKALSNAVYHDANTAVISSSGIKPKYFSFATTSVNLSLSAVVEIIHVGFTMATLNSTQIVNLDTNDGSISIDDGYCIPLYGYGFATSDGIYPDTVAFVGNRLVLTGRVSRIVFSNADWNYRGISFNNCQISSINFSETSAFSVSIGQGSSIVKGFASVNGVTIVSTDTGVYRVSSSSSATKPPNASDAIVTRISNELVPNGDCFSVFGNRVYYISNNGLYALEYSEQTQELVNQSMSTNVSNQFVNIESLSYVEELRSFLITFSNSSNVLAMNIDSESYYTLKFATSLKPQIDDEGFYFNVPGSGVTYMVIGSFVKDFTQDLSNSTLSFSFPGRNANVTNMPSNVDTLVCPAELVPMIAGNNKVILAPGANHVRSLYNDSFTITEYPSLTGAMPIDCYLVTKAFFSDRLDRSNRVRGVSLITNGIGSIATAIVHPSNDFVDRANTIDIWNITSFNYQGELMVNSEYPNYLVRASAGNTNVIKLRQLGITESWQLAIQLNNIRLLGMQFDTSVKSRKRLR